ncbi:P1 family peptidase [Litorimonas sp. WD9-15]|uniref:P1 family peptidase n=1 Tax=Litorimonas sp. WD9-15 TaxID=3418716 RepID=UPI003D010D71
MIDLLPGYKIGQAQDARVKTGVTIILPDNPAIASVDVRGGGPGTREISALQDGGLIEQVHALMLSGGSVYGLAAADGATAWLGGKGIGYAPGPAPIPVSPIVPSAILFDNANGGDKDWGQTPPFRDLAISACEAAEASANEGSVGAGYGATAGLYPGGLGIATERVENISVQAVIAANPVGSPFMPGTNCPWAWVYERDGEFGSRRPPEGYRWSDPQDTKLAFLKAAGQSTVIGAIMTDAALTQKQLKRLAIMAQDGIAMAVQPAHTPLDGDTLFALSLGDKSCERPIDLAALGAAAARAVARALTRGVLLAL